MPFSRSQVVRLDGRRQRDGLLLFLSLTLLEARLDFLLRRCG